MGHPEIQLRSFGRCGRVGHPPVNGKPLEKEELFGLSSKAIDRWIAANRLENDAPLVRLVKATSEKLFFLAEKSQEQVSDAYATVAADIDNLTAQISIAANETSVSNVKPGS
jgi:hypothetical protein